MVLVIAELMTQLQATNLIALLIFVASWAGMEIALDHSRLRFSSLSGLMAHQRREWMLVLVERELRIVDTSILATLQQGAAFFASTAILAIGGCFALMGSTDLVLEIYKDLPIRSGEVSRSVFELKAIGLGTIFVYSFFKFTWSYRLFNYCAILIGAVQIFGKAPEEELKKQALKAADMNIVASRHFNAGLRSLFFALAYIGWFVGPQLLVITTFAVVLVLIRRQYFSNARKILFEK